MSIQQGTLPPWLPPIEAHVQLLVVRRYRLSSVLELGLTALLAAAILAGAGFAGLLRPQTVLAALAAVGLGAALLYGRWYATSFTLTPRTMIFRTGLLLRSCRFVALETLQDVSTRQSLLGSLLGFGDVELSLQSGAREKLSSVPRPGAVRDRIYATRMNGTPW